MYRSVICFVLFVFLLVAAALSGPAYALTIPEAKLLADNEPVTLEARCVTYAAADFFYVEEDSRAMGIRVEKPAHGLTPGMRADVTGTMKTTTARERYILATSAVQNGEGMIAPVGMTNMSLGGEDWHVDGTKGQKGVSGGLGLNNVGLLVRIWGRFEQVDEATFTVDDGSGPVWGRFEQVDEATFTVDDGSGPAWGPAPAATTLATAWHHVAVTGICSVWKMSGSIFPPLILVRDITNTYAPPATTEMVYIPAGSFYMGSGYSDPPWPISEQPQREVYLSGYSIGKYEVTRGEYRRFMEAWGYSNPAYWSSDGWNWKVSNSRTEPVGWAADQDWGTGTFTQTDSHPVVGVSYYEAEAYCAWAGAHLPTEAQWEKAARGTASYLNVWPWGDEWDAERCNNWYDRNSAGGGFRRYQTAPVGCYGDGSPYGYGCRDMAGNVAEWCADWYQEDYYSVSPTTDPPGPASGSERVMRGGSWGNGVGNHLRCASRYYGSPGGGNSGSGFRLAR